MRRDVRVLQFSSLLHGIADDHLRRETAARDRAAAPERLELRVRDCLAVRAHLDLQLDHVPATRFAHQRTSHRLLLRVELAHVARLVEVVDHHLVVPAALVPEPEASATPAVHHIGRAAATVAPVGLPDVAGGVETHARTGRDRDGMQSQAPAGQRSKETPSSAARKDHGFMLMLMTYVVVVLVLYGSVFTEVKTSGEIRTYFDEIDTMVVVRNVKTKPLVTVQPIPHPWFLVI